MNGADDEAKRRRARTISASVLAALLMLFAVLAYRELSSPSDAARSASTSASATDVGVAVPTSSIRWVPGSNGQMIAVPVATGTPRNLSEAERKAWLEQLKQTRATYLEKSKLPPDSLPLAGKTDLIDPHFVATLRRPLQKRPDKNEAGNIQLTLDQSQLFLSEGETAAAFLGVTASDGTKPHVTIVRASLSRADAKTMQQGPPLRSISFHDDGVPPDAKAGDNVFSAAVPPDGEVLKGVVGRVLVDVEISAADEHGSVSFQFIANGAIPAKFTGIVRSVLEGGSLAYYVGVEVLREGNYSITGRIYDAANKPAALATWGGPLTKDSHEVRLYAFGKTLRDQGLSAPFSLKDVDGFLWLNTPELGTDRATMAVLPGPYASEAFAMTALSDAEWDSPERSSTIDDIDRRIARGPSEVAPVDSNGIPIPPVKVPFPSATPK